LHRLFVSGSDRAAEKWRADYRIEGTEALQLHHLYRAMALLAEPLADQAGASQLTPRCRKDLVEEGLFARRRDLFTELSVVFMDTTSLSFRGTGRRGAWSSRPFERLPPGSPSDDRRAGHGSGRQAAVLRAVARQHRRCHHPVAGRRPVARSF